MVTLHGIEPQSHVYIYSWYVRYDKECTEISLRIKIDFLLYIIVLE